MGIDVVVFIFGAILLATGLWGGGVSIKDLSIPKIGAVPRVASIGLGLFIIFMGISLNEIPSDTVSPPPEPSPEPSDPSTPSTVMSSPVSGSDPDQEFREQVGQQLLLISQRVGDGYELTHEPYLGQLEDNTQEKITLELSSGVSYRIVGVCDADCRDIDLELYDENDNLIDSDTMTDDVPIVEVLPQWDGPFTLNVSIPSCAARYCYYGIGTFGQ